MQQLESIAQRKTLINIVVDNMSKTLEDAMLESYIGEKYTLAVESMVMKSDKLEEFLADMQNNDYLKGDLARAAFDFSETNVIHFIENEGKYFIRISSVGKDDIVVLYFYGVDLKTSSEMYSVFKKYEHQSTDNNAIITNITLMGNGSLSLNDKKFKELSDYDNVSTSYYPFLDVKEMFTQYMESKDKLLLLSGSPGTGKTKIIDLFVKHALQHPEAFGFEEDEIEEGISIKIAYVKNTDILSMDSFWTHLTSHMYDAVILDDVDHILIDRNSAVQNSEDVNRKKFITQFLSYADGIHQNNTKFILTTNQEVSSIDKAILRKGRAFDVLNFRPLKLLEAKKIWLENELTEDTFNKEFDSDNILACDLGSKINFYLNYKGKKEKPKKYVLEDGISIIKSVNSKKIKIGEK